MDTCTGCSAYEIPVVRVQLVRESSVVAANRSIRSPADAATVLRELIGDRDRETFAVLMLNAKHSLIAGHIASVGTLDYATVEPRQVFRAAILRGALSVILGHNHPSGDVHPSPADRAVTEHLVKAGQLLGIRVLDHIIVALGGAWTSLAERGVPFPERARRASGTPAALRPGTAPLLKQ